MIATNALLTIAFSLVANFTNNVPIEPAVGPCSVADLRRYVVGTRSSPIDINLFCNDGSIFGIMGGALEYFRSSESYFQLQNPALILRFQGESRFTQDQIIQIAQTALRKLEREGDPLTNGAPSVREAGSRDGLHIPFYLIHWPDASRPGRTSADVEIDGRTGRIVYMELWDKSFRDHAYAEKIKSAVYKPEESESSPVKKEKKSVAQPSLPKPSTNQVIDTIRDGAWLCERLHLRICSTNLGEVDWERTWLYSDPRITVSSQICRVRFTDNCALESASGAIIGVFSADACYSGIWDLRPKEEWEQFKGPIIKKRRDLADELQKRLVERVGIPASTLEPFTVSLPKDETQLDTHGLNRDVLLWRNWPKDSGRFVRTSETQVAFSAEFDLETGAVKFIKFYDTSLIEALRRAASRKGNAR